MIDSKMLDCIVYFIISITYVKYYFEQLLPTVIIIMEFLFVSYIFIRLIFQVCLILYLIPFLYSLYYACHLKLITLFYCIM